MSVCMCFCVHSATFTPGAKAAGPIGTDEIPFDKQERWKDDGANRETWVPLVTCHMLPREPLENT